MARPQDRRLHDLVLRHKDRGVIERWTTHLDPRDPGELQQAFRGAIERHRNPVELRRQHEYVLDVHRHGQNRRELTFTTHHETDKGGIRGW